MVLVCHDKRFVFLKTSKTAGTSIEMLLEPFCAPPGHVPKEETPPIHSSHGIIGRRMLPARTPKILHRRWNRWVHHMPASAVKKYLGPERWQAYSKITIVRNPFDRAASQFYWKNRGVISRDTDLATQRRAFAEFLDSDRFKTDREIVFIGDNYVIDHAIRFEDMAGGLRDLSGTLGYRRPAPHQEPGRQTQGDLPRRPHGTGGARQDRVSDGVGLRPLRLFDRPCGCLNPAVVPRRFSSAGRSAAPTSPTRRSAARNRLRHSACSARNRDGPSCPPA